MRTGPTNALRVRAPEPATPNHGNAQRQPGFCGSVEQGAWLHPIVLGVVVHSGCALQSAAVVQAAAASPTAASAATTRRSMTRGAETV